MQSATLRQVVGTRPPDGNLDKSRKLAGRVYRCHHYISTLGKRSPQGQLPISLPRYAFVYRELSEHGQLNSSLESTECEYRSTTSDNYRLCVPLMPS